MSDSQVEEIKSKLNIVDVIADYVQLKKVGANFKARCPFHQEKTASFYVSPARQIWHCFGCSLGGDVFEFIKQIESVDFREALEKLSQKAGVTLVRRAPADWQGGERDKDTKKILYELNDLAAKFYHKTLLESQSAQEAREYLQKRNFSAGTIATWRLGYAPDGRDFLYQFLKKRGYSDADILAAGLAGRGEQGGYYDRFRDRITFPILDAANKTVGFSARLLHPREDVGKYINSPDSQIYNKSRVLFGFYLARTEIRRQNTAVIVEGNADVIKSHQAGITNVVASSGTALTEQQLELLKRLCENLVFAFDADAAGLVAARRALDLALSAGFTVKLINLAEGLKDPDEIVDSDPELWKRLVAEAVDYLDFYFHHIFDILDVTSASAKKKAKDNFSALLVKVRDRTIAEHYTHEAALVLGQDERTLVEELNGLRKKELRPEAPPATGKAGKPEIPMQEVLEQRLLGLLFAHPDKARPTATKLVEEDFVAAEHRQLFASFRQYLKEHETFSAEEFSSVAPGAKSLLDLAVFSSEVSAVDPDTVEKELKALGWRLRSTALSREKERLAAEIAAAEKAGQQEQKQNLVLEFNSLLQKLGALEQENE
jgi:DNA primase